ncbi:hypothetical protein BU17DRAFT_101011 [Hysterangium stoloniferum]|nr:hypothetical protein BU17DRAFT_101011 [Hysterangium stoloniferum]
MVGVVQILDGSSAKGAIIIAVAAMFAIFFLSLTFLHMSLVLFVPSYARRMASTQERNFITSPLGFYIISLLVGNYISAIGGILELQWIGPRTITQGPACTMQAIFLQLGNNATALWMGVLSISALRTFMLRARVCPKYVALPLICFLWACMIVFDFAASTIFKHSFSSTFFYGPAGMWCWITPHNRVARMVTLYGWMWFWSFVSAICFLLVLLSVRGNIVVKVEASGSTFKWRARSFDRYAFGGVEEQYGNLVGGVGKTMSSIKSRFPVSYIVLTFPLSVTRISETYGFPAPTYAFTLAAVVFFLLGIVNPALYFAIRHSLIRAAVRNGGVSESTSRNSYGLDKTGIDSFETPPERRPSNGNKFASYPWTPTSTTKEWVLPSQYREAHIKAQPASPIVYGANNGANGAPLSVYGTPASVQRNPGSTPRASFSSTPPQSVQLPSVAEIPEHTSVTSIASLNISSPSDTENFAHVPLTPGFQAGRRRLDSDASISSGPQRSPNMNTLIAAIAKEPTAFTGLPPPPRKARRSPTPSVPIDVDESDDGSVCSAQPAVQAFNQDETLPISPGDVATRNPKRADSMRTFWAAYEDPSPISSNMPLPPDALLRRDTMRSFWAAYERSPDVPSFPEALVLGRNQTMSSYRGSVYSGTYKQVDSSAFCKPSTFSTVGSRSVRQGDVLSPPLMSPPTMSPSFSSMVSPPLSSHSSATSREQHRRSRSLTSVVTFAAPPLAITPSVSRQVSANAVPSRFGSPQPNGRSAQNSRNNNHRAQPGYV